MNISIGITAHHNGRFGFRICRVLAPAPGQTWEQAEREQLSEECFNQARAAAAACPGLQQDAGGRDMLLHACHPCLGVAQRTSLRRRLEPLSPPCCCKRFLSSHSQCALLYNTSTLPPPLLLHSMCWCRRMWRAARPHSRPTPTFPTGSGRCGAAARPPACRRCALLLPPNLRSILLSCELVDLVERPLHHIGPSSVCSSEPLPQPSRCFAPLPSPSPPHQGYNFNLSAPTFTYHYTVPDGLHCDGVQARCVLQW
jgi:hypothetical protein